MKNKPPQKAEFVKNITDRDGEIGELYTVESEFFVVKWYRDDVERKPCKHNTIFTEVWQSDKKGKVGCGRDPIHEWQRWHSGKSIMAQFLKSRACPSPVEILAQNRDTLLERMNESGNAYSDEYPHGLMGEAEEEIKLLRVELLLVEKERDEARLMYCEQKANPPGCEYNCPEYASAIAFNKGWDCYDHEPPQQ